MPLPNGLQAPSQCETQDLERSASARSVAARLAPATLALRTALIELRPTLGSAFVDALLREPSCAPAAGSAARWDTIPRPWRGFAKGALYHSLLEELLLWGADGVFPLTFVEGPQLPCFDSDAIAAKLSGVLATDGSDADLCRLAVARAARERSATAFRAALEHVGARGIARLLGCRTTAGTVGDALPPLRERLVEAAAVRIGGKEGARISVAARALMKHCGRRGEGWRECYWGLEDVVMYGGDEEKNERAAKVVERVLDDCVWMNIHHAPGGTRVLELRVESGQGIRWHADDGVFRGLVEPHSKEIALQRKEQPPAGERWKEGEKNICGDESRRVWTEKEEEEQGRTK